MPVAAAAAGSAALLGSGWLRGFALQAASGPGGLAAIALLSAAFARLALPRLADAPGCWLLSLPASHAARRRSLLAGLVLSAAPVWGAGVFLGLAALPELPGHGVRFLAGLPVAAAAGAMFAAADRIRLEGALLAAASAIVGALPYPGALAAAACLLWLADLSCGAWETPRRAAQRRTGPGSAALDLRIALRAAGTRLLGGLVLSGLPLAAAALFLANNDLPAGASAAAARLAGLLATTQLLAAAVSVLQTRRPTWPWRRSLPDAALSRVGRDSLLFLALSIPVLGATAALDLEAAPAIAAAAPLLAARAARALRVGSARSAGAAGEVLLEGAVVAFAVAVAPALSWSLLALAPAALALAARDDQRQRQSAFDELSHRSSGDTASWSD